MSDNKRYDALFDGIMQKAGAIPYRVGGRVRVAYTEDTSPQAVEQMRAAVKVMTDRAGLGERVAEPDAATKRRWDAAGLTQLDVCDEPCPEGVSLVECPVSWLVERAGRYHVRFFAREDGRLGHEGLDGWQKDDRTVTHKGRERVVSGYLSVTPRWFLDAVVRRKAEVIAHLKSKQEGQS